MLLVYQNLEEIKKHIQKIVPLNEEEWAILKNGLQKIAYSKGDSILSEGDYCDFICVVETGLFRFYSIKEGNEKITEFWFPFDFMSDYRSFLSNTPSTYNIEAMQSGTIWKIKRDYLNKLYKDSVNFNKLGRIVAEQIFLMKALRLDSFLTDSPKERYLKLLSKDPNILQAVPQYMIASYLGITPESLSRIRKRI